MMDRIYIGNAKWPKLEKGEDARRYFSVQSCTIRIEEKVITFERSVPEGDVEQRESKPLPIRNDDHLYVIDVHCGLKQSDGEVPHHFGGLTIYRYLLKLYDRHPEKLKVVFYSPIELDTLVKISKGEHYVLKLLPFVHWRNEPEFMDRLNEVVEEYERKGWPQFVVASENLLSGWAAQRWKYNNGIIEKIHIPAKHRILIVDDQMAPWRKTFEVVFEGFPDRFIVPEFGSQSDFHRDWDFIIKQDVIVQAENATAVISDLYLAQHHEETKKYFKSNDELKGISGFQLLTALKEKYPFLPYMMYTSSNKVWNYEVFHSHGIWNWSVKGREPDLKKEDKIEQFEHFESNVNAILDEDWSDIRELWKRLIKLEIDLHEKWWLRNLTPEKSVLRKQVFPPPASDMIRRHRDYEHAISKAKTIVQSLKNQLFLLNRGFVLRKGFESLHTAAVDALNYAQIVLNVHGIVEELKMVSRRKDSEDFNVIASFLFLIRGYFAHGLYADGASRSDAILAFSAILDILEYRKRSDIVKVVQHTNSKQTNEQVMPEFVKGLNFLYYAVFRSVMPSNFGNIGRRHLLKLIANGRNLGNLLPDFQKLYDKIGLDEYGNVDPRWYSSRIRYGKAKIIQAAMYYNKIIIP